MKKYIYLVFLMPQIVFGDVLCEDCKMDVTIDDFSGGLNTAVSLQKIPLSMSPNIRNLLIDDKPGSLKQRNGFIVVGSSMTLRAGNGVTGIFPYYSEDGTTKFLVTDSSIVLETSDFGTWVTVGTGFNTSVLLRCIQVRNKMWCTNGSDAPFTWDSSTRVTLNGTVGTPNVPKFKYPIYYQERVFGLNTSANGSSLDFSAIIDTNNALIAPDNFLAWPAENRVNVGQGDGQVGVGLWVQDGLLRVGKQNSVYTLYGTEPYVARKTDSQVGVVSADSIVILDGNAYFLGPDGIYENLRRISDAFSPDIETFQKDTTQTLENLWETQSDFDKGSFIHGTTATVGGFVTILRSSFAVNGRPGSTGGGFGGDLSIASAVVAGVAQTTTSGNSFITFSVSTFPSFNGYIDRIEVFSRHGAVSSSATARMTIGNSRTNQYESADAVIDFGASGGDVGNLTIFTFRTGNVLFTGTDLFQSSMQIKIEYLSGTASPFVIHSPTVATHGLIILNPVTTGQFMSEVSTLTSVTAWGNFDSVKNTNGGTVDYFIRTSTSSVNIATQVWANISPGVRINAPTINNYVQWAATVTSVSTYTNTTNFDNVTIGHIEGAGSVNRAFAIDWKNRFLMAVATETSGDFSLIYVKARATNPRPDAFVLFDGINIRSFAKDRTNTLYGGSASTGTVYRLDYGTNDNGQAITSVYETPGLTFGSVYKDKVVQKMLLDGQRESGASIKFGISADGAAYTERSISIDGSGRYTSVVEGLTPNSRGKMIQFRIKQDQLDKGLTFDNLTPIYRETEVLK